MLERERDHVADESDERSDTERLERRECAVCGESVPAAIYNEHLLKECPGR